jgi:hypothetical protein
MMSSGTSLDFVATFFHVVQNIPARFSLFSLVSMGEQPDGTGIDCDVSSSSTSFLGLYIVLRDGLVMNLHTYPINQGCLHHRRCFPFSLPCNIAPACRASTWPHAPPSVLCFHPTSLPIREGTQKIMNSFLKSKMAFASDQSTASRDFLRFVPILRLLFDNWRS